MVTDTRSRYDHRLAQGAFAIFVGAALCGASTKSLAADLPDRALTPGWINTNVTQANIGNTVCVKGWSKTNRPPVAYTNKIKALQIREYGYEDTDLRHYEEDHLVPISLGGHPTDPRNLWPEPRMSQWGAARKDALEFAVYRGMCRGEISLGDAQRAFAVNWIAAYRRYGFLLRKYHHGRAD
jgi:hypothetical protein